MAQGKSTREGKLCKGVKFRIDPSKEQEEIIQRHFDGVCLVWNYANALRIQRKEDHQTLKESDYYYTVIQNIPGNEWMKTLSSSALAQEAKRYKKRYDWMWEEYKKTGRINPPRFKKPEDPRNSYTIQVQHCHSSKPQGGGAYIDWGTSTVYVSKVGRIKAKLHRRFKGEITFATISRTKTGKYYISFTVYLDRKPPQLPKTGKAIGIDIGVKDRMVTSDGTIYPNERIRAKYNRELVLLQRKMARSDIEFKKRREEAIKNGTWVETGEKHSKTWYKHHKKFLAIHEKITEIRKDIAHKRSAELVRENDLICVEKLKVKNMLRKGKKNSAKKRGLHRNIADVAPALLLYDLKYKAKERGKEVQEVGQNYPSTQICNNYGERTGPKGIGELGVREWVCSNCHAHNHRDHNAANNILDEGIRLHEEEKLRKEGKLPKPKTKKQKRKEQQNDYSKCS